MISPLPRVSELPAEWRPLAVLAPVAQAWRDLAARAIEPNVFYEPSFALAAAPVFGADAGAVLVWSNGAPKTLLGFFPARLKGWRHGAFPTLLAGWTHPFAPLGTPLVDSGHAEAVIASWLDCLTENPSNPALLLMPLLPEEGPFATALDQVLARRGAAVARLDRHRRAMLVPGADRGEYLRSALSAKMRKELNRRRRRLADLGPVEHTVVENPAGIGAALEDFMALEARGWKGRIGTAMAQQPEIRAFARQAIPMLAAEGKARADRLTVGGRLIAATIALRSGSTVWGWKTAYDESCHRFSPGVQVILDLTQDLLEDPTIARIDSGATPDHPMIDHLWRERLALSDRLILLRPTAAPVFAFVCRLETLHRAAIRAAKAVRDRLRRHRLGKFTEATPARATGDE